MDYMIVGRREKAEGCRLKALSKRQKKEIPSTGATGQADPPQYDLLDLRGRHRRTQTDSRGVY